MHVFKKGKTLIFYFGLYQESRLFRDSEAFADWKNPNTHGSETFILLCLHRTSKKK